MSMRALSMIAAIFAGSAVYGTDTETAVTSYNLMAGMVNSQADMVTFANCKGGDLLPVARKGSYLALEEAYVADRVAPLQPLYAVLDGQVEVRSASDGRAVEALVVERVIQTRPDLSCERQKVDAEMENTYWKLDILEGVPFPQGTGRREAHLVLESGEEGQYRATVGCNAIRGTYTLKGSALRFAGGAMTLMACPPPLDQLERQFNSMLSNVTNYTVAGETLVLRDAEGTPKAVFSAVYF